MSNPIKYRAGHPPCSLETIRRVENELQLKLPEEYVRFMLEQNGGCLDFNNKYFYDLPAEYPEPELSVEEFFPVEQLSYYRGKLRENFGMDLLPIGLDDFGNFLCLETEGDAAGSVYFFDHEILDEETGQNLLVRIASKFGSFVEALTSRRDI